MTAQQVTLTPLGGSGEFGTNCMAITAGDRILVIDAGTKLAAGADSQMVRVGPDLSWLRARRERIEGVVLTHGHDDHVGALAEICAFASAPVWGSPFTLGLADRRLRESGPPQARLRTVRDRQRVEIGPFGVEFVPVTHSIPGTTALVITTPAGTIVHSADFKLDADPVDGRLTDLARLRAAGDAGVRALLVDSSNAMVPGRTPSERTVGPAIARLIAGAPGAVFLCSFASHIHRIQQAADALSRSGRRLSLIGSRLVEAADLAAALGLLRIAPDLRVSARAAAALPRSRMAWFLSGSQAEPGSALVRLGAGVLPEARVHPGDRLLYLGRPIPGNEQTVVRVLGEIARQGADVHASADAGLHVSGHGAQQDLVEMIDVVRPRALVPVHGTRAHLEAAAALAGRAQPPPPEAIVLLDGERLALAPEGAKKIVD